MGLLTPIKANKAYRLQQKGQREEARKLYEEAYAEGLNDPRYNQAYALLMTRMGEYQKAKEFLVKHQKTPGMSQDQRVTMLVNYAACCFRLGNIDKGIDTMEQQFRKTETGLLYQTLGYLYIEKYDAANKPAFDEVPVTEEAPAEAAEETTAEGEENEAAEEKTLSPQEAWDAGVKKAEDFILKSLEYDDEDPISLDNMGQFIYRVKGDKEGAKAWFDKAIALKDKQIDTLYFLSRYDLEAGDREAAIEKLEKAAKGNFSPLNYCSRETILKEIEKLKGAN
jgi:tetratricopeptide (TPR) repeat protein